MFMRKNISNLVFIGIIIGVLFIAGCSIIEEKQIIKCTNLIFDCSHNDCATQCGAFTSTNNKVLVSSQPVNNGQGCECKYHS